MRVPLLALSLLLSSAVALAEGGERPLAGDLLHGARLWKQAAGRAAPRVDGAWLNRYSDRLVLKGLSSGRAGFPRVDGDNVLDRWDVLAFLRAHNADVRDLLPDASHLLLSTGELDQYAKERLSEKAGLKLDGKDDAGPVYVGFKLREPGADVVRVREKSFKKRDKLKPDDKVGYVMFMPLEGVRGGGYEVAMAISPDIQLTAVEVRAPDGTRPADLNQAARRFVGRGARGKYERLRAPGAGKAMRELTRPLSDAFLLAAERVYMFEVKERDYFTFGG